MKNLKFVTSDDWNVIYGDMGEKIWEGHYIDGNGLSEIINYFGLKLEYYKFTNEDEIDGCTPDNFNDIIGIKKDLIE